MQISFSWMFSCGTCHGPWSHPASSHTARGSMSKRDLGTCCGVGRGPGPETREKERQNPHLRPRRSRDQDRACSGDGLTGPQRSGDVLHSLPSQHDPRRCRDSWDGDPTAEAGNATCLEPCVRHDFLRPWGAWSKSGDYRTECVSNSVLTMLRWHRAFAIMCSYFFFITVS